MLSSRGSTPLNPALTAIGGAGGGAMTFDCRLAPRRSALSVYAPASAAVPVVSRPQATSATARITESLSLFIVGSVGFSMETPTEYDLAQVSRGQVLHPKGPSSHPHAGHSTLVASGPARCAPTPRSRSLHCRAFPGKARAGSLLWSPPP